MARQPFSSSMPELFDPYSAIGGRRSTLPAAYYFLKTVLIAGALAGGLVALYRNDLFLELARRIGQEPRYLELEKFVVGTPGWGTPRSMLPVLAGTDDGAPAGAPAPAALALPTIETSPAAASPVAPTPLASAPVAPLAAQAAPAPAPSPVAATQRASAPVDPLAPVSLESLPLLGAKPAPAPVSMASLPAASPAPVARSFPSTSGSKARAVPVSLDDSAAAPARAPKAKPEPAPAPAPVAAKPEPKGPKTTDPHPHDNPLQAAIRSAVKARPPKDTVPQ